jgi:hypothetical protein
MEEENNENSNGYNNKKNPIFNYYSHIINRQNSLNNLKFYQISQNFPTKLQLSTNHHNYDNNENNKNNETIKENKKEEIGNNKILTEQNNDNSTDKSDANSNIENQNVIRITKEIRSDDLVPTLVNGRTILRINPYVYVNESYDFLSDNIYILLKDQSGCKYLQEKLDIDTENAVYYFYPALLPNLLILIKDAFANYFIQKICGYLNECQIEYLLKIISSEFYEICCDIYGTRAIQGIMNYLKTEKLRLLFFDLIKPIFIPLIDDINGIHIIYKLIQDFPELLDQTNNIIIENCVILAKHKRGCNFLENYLRMINDTIYKQKIIDILINNISILIIDPKANFIIQYIINLGDNNIIKDIINKIVDNIPYYSKHKYSNYVIEKLIMFSNDDNRNIIINILTKQEIINDLVLDQQGSFIILKALKFADKEKRNFMISKIKYLEPKIKNTPNGNIILNQIHNNNLYLNNNKYRKKNYQKFTEK